MTDDGRIVLSSSALLAAQRDAAAASAALERAAPSLRSAIPADAFGAVRGGHRGGRERRRWAAFEEVEGSGSAAFEAGMRGWALRHRDMSNRLEDQLSYG